MYFICCVQRTFVPSSLARNVANEIRELGKRPGKVIRSMNGLLEAGVLLICTVL